MGTKATARRERRSSYLIIPGDGPVAQVAHPTEISWRPEGAIQLLLQGTADLPAQTTMVLTGGGFLTLNYPHPPPRPRLVRQAGFLQRLGEWTENELVDVIQTIEQSCDSRDFVIGVDVLVNEQGSGQFALGIGRNGYTLVAKRYPVNGEARYLAGVDATTLVYGNVWYKRRSA